MEFLGFSKDAILRFKSYLSNRKFKVNLNKTFLDQGKLYISFSKETTMKIRLLQLFFHHPSHNFVFI